jgi:DNA-binding LacI/PurR family transcriptional regulator
MGKRAAELLIDEIEGKRRERVFDILSPELIVGDSSGPPPALT